MKKDKQLFDNLWAFCLAIVSSFAIAVNVGPVKFDPTSLETNSPIVKIIWQIAHMFNAPTYSLTLIIVLLIVLYRIYIPKIDKKLIPINIVFSVLGGFALVLCKSYYRVNSWDNVFGSATAFISAILATAGYAVIWFFVFDLINKASIKMDNSMPSKKRYRIYSIIIFILWIPYIFALLPGAANADILDQFAQITGNKGLCWTANTIVLKNPDVILNNHHPVFHTLFLGIFFKLGELIGSQFVSFSILACLQCVALDFVMCYSIYSLKEFGISKKCEKAFLLIIAFCPLFPLWGASLFKDTPFTLALIPLTVLLYKFVKHPNDFKKRQYFLIGFLALLLMLFRNNGLYMVVALMPFIVIHFWRNKKAGIRLLIVLLIPVLIFKVGFTTIFFNACDITEGSKREMLSVPFQQTARYVQEYADEITPEEEKVILNTIKTEEGTLQSIADAYVTDRADSIKSNFNKNLDSEGLKDYITVWAKQLTKHPMVYVEAFLNLNYSWICFDSHHDIPYYNGIIDKNIKYIDKTFRNPKQLTNYRNAVYQFINLIDRIPVLGAMFEMSIYTWAYLIIFIIMLIRKKHDELLCMLMLLINLAICFIGPVAYMRYMVPMVFLLPFFVAITLLKKEDKGEKDG